MVLVILFEALVPADDMVAPNLPYLSRNTLSTVHNKLCWNLIINAQVILINPKFMLNLAGSAWLG